MFGQLMLLNLERIILVNHSMDSLKKSKKWDQMDFLQKLLQLISAAKRKKMAKLTLTTVNEDTELVRISNGLRTFSK